MDKVDWKEKDQFAAAYRETRDGLMERMNTVMEDGASCVYIAYCEGTGLCKIGFSNRVAERIQELAAASAYRVWLMQAYRVYEPFARPFEKLLHKTFAHRRTHGEWFKLSAIELSWIGQNAFPFCINFATCGPMAEPRSVFEGMRKND